tara:strand:+ start:185 stop:328 length:144 start_codon:yes stop_codon:yes gene_type:complete
MLLIGINRAICGVGPLDTPVDCLLLEGTRLLLGNIIIFSIEKIKIFI